MHCLSLRRAALAATATTPFGALLYRPLYDSASRHKLIDGKRLAKAVKARVKTEAIALTEAGWAPRLVSLSFGQEDEAMAIYVRNQRRAAKACGIEFDDRVLPADMSGADAAALVSALNMNRQVSGIIIQRPVPAHLNIGEIQQMVHPLKDVEGMPA